MKLVIVCDLHLATPGERVHGLDPLAGLDACIDAINREQPDADLVVFAGDLANDGELAAYAALARRIDTLMPPHRFMMGNHDDRAAFLTAFPDTAADDGFIHSSADLDGTRLILLDTLWPGHVAGTLCDARLAWLDRQLSGARDALLVMHHPPHAIGIESLDECRLSNPDALLRVLDRHGNVRHIFAGHVHRLSHGSWHGIPCTTLRGTNHQTALKFSGPHEVSFEQQAYAIVVATEDGFTVHVQDFFVR
ncbi:phosphodiesterase [Aquamicrobium sp. NLF2-7]|uniref:phosphodiesterase n=1 Tax=Aquamicrobium sp. NLF2-7 TaxID=2918753 RepID=UPI001EFB8B7B|nr:phosphodiesterase [Aquamicrobium sp. NLF2-7]MCG8273848.1 phosphodiesterase [Aquamicrobium sp. NLF2-7]